MKIRCLPRYREFHSIALIQRSTLRSAFVSVLHHGRCRRALRPRGRYVLQCTIERCKDTLSWMICKETQLRPFLGTAGSVNKPYESIFDCNYRESYDDHETCYRSARTDLWSTPLAAMSVMEREQPVRSGGHTSVRRDLGIALRQASTPPGLASGSLWHVKGRDEMG